MVTGNIPEESYKWQFTNSMLDCTNILIPNRKGDAGGEHGGLE